MPKTPESGGIPLPYSWPPFNRADWDNRAYALLASLSRMGHEDEDYASVPAAINLSKKALAKAASQREESSLGLAKIKNKEKKAVGDGVEGGVTKQEEGTTDGTTTEKSTVEEGDNNNNNNGDNTDNKESDVKKEDEEEDDPNQLKVKPTKVLKTFEQRRKYIVKVMDLHRHTVGGGRSGRRGRAESTAFFRYVLQILDEQYEEALEAGSQDDDDDGKYVKGEENNDDDSSSSEEETEEDNVMEGGEVEGEDLDEGSDVGDSEAEPSQPKTTPRRRGRPPKNQSSTPSSSKKSKSPRAATKVVINEQEFFDQHNDLCEVCNQPGELLCCATCNLVFHVACARPRLTKEPPDDWNCSYCWAAGVRGGKKDGKERRKAAQACREMEKMRKTLREERERNGGNVKDESLDDEEEEEMSEEETEEEEGDDDEVDKKPAPKKRGPRQYSSGPRPSLEEAAAAGCRKCVRELDTGEKTRKVHDDWCPRKFQGPGRPSASPGSATKKRKKEEEDEAEESEEEDEIEESEVEESASEEEETISELKESRSTSPKNVRKDGKISLEVAAKACNKCKLELETGEKTRKSHADNCPRKFRGKSTSPVPPPVASSEADGIKMHAADDAVELPKDTVSNDDEDAAAAAPSKKSGRKGGRPPAKKKRGPNPKNLVPLEEAAKFCVKCERELETGEKTRKEHSEDCPRKWRSAGRPPAGTPSPASAVAAAERQAKKSPPLAQPKSPVRSSSRKRGKRNRDQMEDTAEDEPAIATTATAEEEAIAGLGDLATMAMKQEEENKSDGGNDETADKMDTEEEDAGGGEAKSLRGGGETDGGVTFTVDDGAVETEQVPSSMAFVHGEIDYVDDEAQPLRGGGRTKKAPVKTEEIDVNVTVNDEAVVAPEGTPTNSGASTPTKRELDYLTVPTPLKLGDEHDLTYANNGRVQRSRKKPAVFDPQDVPAREWGLKSGDDNSPDKVEPEELRGGMVKPSKEVTAAKLAAEAPVPTAPRRGRPPKNASLTAEAPASAPTAPRRGRPPTKQTKGGKKKNAARAPIKKETNTTVGGVGLLNRKPGVLFDCPVCLDLPKIKFCCYCACRICFNKFGKEQTMLCDTCDQEYHTFCLGLDKIPDGGFECPACIADAEKKRKAGERKKEREAKKRLEEEKRAIEEEKKAIIKAQRKAAYAARKQEEEERKRIQLEKRKIAYEKRKSKEAEMKAQGIPVRGTKSLSPQALGIKRGPGRPSKAEMVARLQAQQALVQKQQEEAAASGKRGRGRPRKDGSAPVPRIKPSKNEIALENMYLDTTDLSAERSRSGRKISRTTFHDDLEGGGLMKKARTDEHGGIPSKSSSGKGSMYVSERRSAVAAKNAISGRGRSQEPRKDSRRKPGARECMQISRKFDAGVIEQKHFDMLMDYSQRGKVDHLIRLRERMDEHSRYLEAQLAGLEALVKEKGEHIDMRVPPAKVD